MQNQKSDPANLQLAFRGIGELKKQGPSPTQFHSNRLRSIQLDLTRLVKLLEKYHPASQAPKPKAGHLLYKVQSTGQQEELSQLAQDKEASSELRLAKIKKGAPREKFAARIKSLRLSKAAYSFCEALIQFGSEDETKPFLKWYEKAQHSGLFDLEKEWSSPSQLLSAYSAQLEALEKIPALGEIWDEVRFSLPELPGLSFLPQPPEAY